MVFAAQHLPKLAPALAISGGTAAIPKRSVTAAAVRAVLRAGPMPSGSKAPTM
jgi:hypothetical protein